MDPEPVAVVTPLYCMLLMARLVTVGFASATCTECREKAREMLGLHHLENISIPLFFVSRGGGGRGRHRAM